MKTEPRLTEEQYLNFLRDHSTTLRGSILDQSVWVSNLVSDIIAQHFCPEEKRRNLFFSAVLAKFEFIKVIDLLRSVLEIEYPDLHTSSAQLLKDITELREFRNRLAHATLDTSAEYLAGRRVDAIQFVWYRKSKQEKFLVTEEEAKDWNRKFTSTIQSLVTLQKTVQNRVAGVAG